MTIAITADWRLASAGNQWTLQRRKKNGWRDVRFHCDRDALLQVSIAELIPEAPEAALRQLRALPRWFGKDAGEGSLFATGESDRAVTVKMAA